MKTLFKQFAIALAIGLAPAAAHAQVTPAESNAIAAQPQPAEMSRPGLADVAQEPPEDQAVAQTFRSPSVAEPGIGQPDGRAALQDQFTPIGQEAAWFHNWILMPSITVISLFVLLLLGWVIVRYRRAANPVPARTTHNTALEVAWTLVPVLILVVIAVPSIRLLSHQYSPPQADITIKAIGNQWYWTYEYPDHDIQFDSTMLPDQQAAARNEPRQLAVDERMVVPAGATVKLIVTSNDVVHAWGVPAFWTKIDAVPGRLNETWFRADRPGIYYGVCYELCGARHGYMPIAVEVLPPAQFAAWVASRGGAMPGSQPARQPASSPTQADVGPGEATESTPAPTTTVPVTQPAPTLPRESTQTNR